MAGAELLPTHVEPIALSEIAKRCSLRLTPHADAPDAMVTGATVSSRDVRPGDLFAALPGFTAHGATYAADAAERGAVAILTDPAGAELARDLGLPMIVTEDARSVTGAVSATIYGNPTQHMAVAGITGSNGKTTVTYFLDAALRAAGHVTGVLGTVEIRIGEDRFPSVRTTAEAPLFQGLLAHMREEDVTAVSVEVSSHALALHRVRGSKFAVAVFTNLQRDHLDFHGTMENYFEDKARLFTPEYAPHGVVLIDDAWGEQLAHEAPIPVVALATRPETLGGDWRVESVRPSASSSGSDFDLVGPAGEVLHCASPLPGAFNVSNAATAVVTAIQLGIDGEVAARAVSGATGVPGRMEAVVERSATDPLVVVDYAHTPDALANVLEGLRPATPGRLICLFGAGGDRDAGKRPDFGRVADSGADVLMVTDDNPRSEDPATIRAQVIAGVTRADTSTVHNVAPRDAAIEAALRMAGPLDTVVLAGKGHESTQEIAGVFNHFSDREISAELYARIAAERAAQ